MSTLHASARRRRRARRYAPKRSRRHLLENLETRRLLAADFGDARLPFPDSASHEAVGPTLGALRDTEPLGQPSIAADADGDDEDGVTFGLIHAGQLDAGVTVNVQAAPEGARLDAWIDFNGDGNWSGPGEQVFDSVGVQEGDNVLEFDVPSGALSGGTQARFRLSTAGGLGIGGWAPDGEVEDYLVAIRPPAAATGVFAGRNTIHTETIGAEAVHAADVDGDGDMDLLSAFFYDGKVAWFENDGTAVFDVHTIATEVEGAVDVSAADMDGDGDLDVLSASLIDDTIAWYENDGDQSFTDHTISTSADGAYSVLAADVDGDGDLDVLSASSNDDTIAWYENDGSQQFTKRVISTTANGAESVAAADVDGDGDLDVLSASFFGDKIAWYENDGNQGFTEHVISFAANGAESVAAADMDGDGDLDVLSASFYDDKIAWYENVGDNDDQDDAPNFVPRVISTTANGAFQVQPVDMDGDGDLDVLGASAYDNTVAWYENDGRQRFTRRVVTNTASGALSAVAADADGDGDLDVFGASYFDDKISWYENVSRDVGWSSTIGTDADSPQGLFVADVDSDGDMDVLSASNLDDRIGWYENDGHQDFTPHDVNTPDPDNNPNNATHGDANGARSVSAADLDGDGDTDVLSASFNDDKIAWYENDGNQNFTAHVITAEADGASSVAAVDLDGDGDIDVLSASSNDDTIAWYENDGDAGFTAHTISDRANFAVSVFAADMDGDGDIDVLGASAFDNRVAWYENDGNQNFTTHDISTDADFVQSVFAADIDGDGDIDVLSASSFDDRITWYENDGNQRFTPHTVSFNDFASSVVAADLDGDGDIDVLSASSINDRIAWYENDGNQQFTIHVVNSAAIGALSVLAADLDGDGDVDMLSASSIDDTIAWYPNIDNTPPHVSGVAFNADQVDPPALPQGPSPTSWTAQRGEIRSIEITFNEPVSVDAADLRLTNLGIDAPADPDRPVALTPDHLRLTGRTLTLTFQPGELTDGVYRLDVLPTAADASGNRLDGDGDGVGGDTHSLTFHRQQADWNGDLGVSILDFSTFAYWFGQLFPAAPEYADLNGDGGVSIFDFPIFASHFGFGVTPPAALPPTTPGLVSIGDPSTYHIPMSEDDFPADWYRPEFDDGSWATGNTALGYETGSLELNPVLAASPVGFWRFSETTGVVTDNEGTGGAALDGILRFGANPDVAGPRPPGFPQFEHDNAAVGLDGTDDFVTVTTSMLSNLSAFTVMGWIRPTDITADRVGLFGQNGVIEFGFSTPTELQIWTQNGGVLTVAHNLPNGEWHHVAATGDGEFLRIFIDGALAAELEFATGNYGASTSRFNIGGGGIFDATGNQFHGEIDEVAVFNRALTEDHIEQLLTIDMDTLVDYTPLIQTDLTDELLDIQTTVLMRQEFRVDDPTDFDTLTLTVHYDDGFVAYLNGQEIARANAPFMLEWDSAATRLHSDILAEQGVDFDVSEFRRNFLRPGDNVLAVHALNSDAGDPDFLIAVELTGSRVGIGSPVAPIAPLAAHLVVVDPWQPFPRALDQADRWQQATRSNADARLPWTPAVADPVRPLLAVDWRQDDREGQDERELEDLLQLLAADRSVPRLPV